MRTKKDKPTAPPLADTIRAALASGWHSLAALDTLTAARGSDARRLVHEALRALRGEGCVLEERVGKAGVEVRLAPATLPAPRPADGQPGDLSPEDIEAIRVALLEAEEDSDGAAYTNEIAPLSPAAAARMAGLIEHPPAPSEALRALCRGEDEPDDYTRFHAALAAAPVEAADAPAPPVDQIAPVEAVGGPVARDLDALREQVRTNASASVSSSLTMAQAWERASVCLDLTPVEKYALCGAFREEWERVEGEAQSGEPSETPFDHPPPRREPGPSSRCAVCEVTYARHEEARRRGGGELHTFTPRPRGRPPAPERAPVAPIPNAAPAILPRVRQCRTPGPVVDVDGGRVERAPFPPCVDCGEEPGTCPEGRCRDCDIEHLMTAGSCRECLTWIMREDMAGPREKQHSIGCSLAAEPCYPRNAAEYIATRKMRYGWTPPQGWKLTGCAAGAAAEPETSRGGGDGLDPDTLDAIRKVIDTAPPSVRERVRARRKAAEAPPPVERCRPPLCYRDDIHEPARVRGFARPLCERHRAWVEGAGGTVASEADVAALHAT